MKNIALIAPDQMLLKQANSALSQLFPGMLIVKGLLEEGVQMAHIMQQKGVEIIISRGHTSTLIKSSGLPVVVVDIPITAFDIVRALQKASKRGLSPAIVSFSGLLDNIELMTKALQIKAKFYSFENTSQAPDKLALALAEGADIIVGGAVTIEAAQKQGCRFEPIESGQEAIFQAVNEAYRISSAKEMEKEKTALFRTVIDHVHEGIIAINAKSEITVFSPKAEELTGIKAFDAIGHKIGQICPPLMLDKLLKSPEENFGQFMSINGNNLITNQIPITNKGVVIGAVSTLQDANHISRMEEAVRKKLFAKGHVAQMTQKDIAGKSPAIKKALHTATQYAATSSSVLILGESGTGKEVFAQTIHNMSSRKNSAFVAINCAALPANILESELFGYVAGAFTGASSKGKAGLFELAHSGSIFLDEIAEMDISIQSKLLRVLEERKVMRLGSDKLLPVDVRVISASNQDLKENIKANRFRQDLYYRLNVLKLALPPLRERKDDIPFLCENFFQRKGYELKLSAGALKVLKNYDWPGNIRELQNILERILAVCGGVTQTIEASSVRDIMKEDIDITAKEPTDEKTSIKDALQRASGHYGKAADMLGMHRSTLWRKMKKLGLIEE